MASIARGQKPLTQASRLSEVVVRCALISDSLSAYLLDVRGANERYMNPSIGSPNRIPKSSASPRRSRALRQSQRPTRGKFWPSRCLRNLNVLGGRVGSPRVRWP
jgi:hypothetical protein